MSKTTYIICFVNMIASAVALFLIFRTPAKPESVLLSSPSTAATAQTPPAPEVVWQQFELAGTLDAATRALAQLPGDDDTLNQVASYVRTLPAARDGAPEFAKVARTGAAIRFLGMHGKLRSPHSDLLQSVAADQQTFSILRELALRAVIDVALRAHASKENTETDNGLSWPNDLAAYLLATDFGVETSVAGLALQAAVFIEKQGVVPIDRIALENQVREVLLKSAAAHEATLLAALETSATTPGLNVADLVRPIVDEPRSEAVLQAAIHALGKTGSRDDQAALLARLPMASGALYRITEAAWVNLETVPKAAGVARTTAAANIGTTAADVAGSR